jgi:hypothetical protein
LPLDIYRLSWAKLNSTTDGLNQRVDDFPKPAIWFCTTSFPIFESAQGHAWFCGPILTRKTWFWLYFVSDAAKDWMRLCQGCESTLTALITK